MYKNKTRKEYIAEQKRCGKMKLGKGRGPRRKNGKLPDWMVVVEVNPRTKIELSDPGPRSARSKDGIAAQLCDWGAMAFSTVRLRMQSSKIGNGNETTFFINEVKVNGGVSAEGRLWKVSIHPEKPPDIECVDENMATEMSQARRDYQNKSNRK
jgi:hypothetical protein